jgi:hypothetical protein
MPAKEDCAARSLVKSKLGDEDMDDQLKGNGEEDPFDDEEDDEGSHNENKESRKEDDGEETGNIGEPKSSEILKENDESRKEDSEETGNGGELSGRRLL